jgi:hypothetical protein
VSQGGGGGVGPGVPPRSHPLKVTQSQFPVPHKEFIFLTPRRVVIATRAGYVNVLDPLHIVSLEEAKGLPTK